MLRIHLLISLALLTAACATAPKGDETKEVAAHPTEAQIDQARQALVPLKTGLQGALQTAMQKGPDNAIEVCRLEAPRLAEAASTNSLQVGRTSHKVRNPDNTPEPWMESYLEEFRDTAPEPGVHRATVLEDGRVAYVEPIYMQAMCVTCHGAEESLAPSIRATLDNQYPEDQATGFAEGDFRGLFWVTLE